MKNPNDKPEPKIKKNQTLPPPVIIKAVQEYINKRDAFIIREAVKIIMKRL